VGHRQPGLIGERDELFDDVEAPFVGEVVEHAGAAQLSQPVPGRGLEHNQRIVAVLVDGLRCGATRRPPAR
jgi:hypothetical protein